MGLRLPPKLSETHILPLNFDIFASSLSHIDYHLSLTIQKAFYGLCIDLCFLFTASAFESCFVIFD